MKPPIKVKPKQVKTGIKKLLDWEYGPYVLAGIIAIVVIVVAVILIRRYRKKKAQAAAEGPEAPPKVRIDLKTIWRTFLKTIPAEYRHAISLYQPFIVLGGAGSGKSSLIDRCTDWRGQAAQFHPSYTDDPLLQIYSGQDAVVQEVSPALLGDVSKPARNALTKLWQILRGEKTPRAVVVVNAVTLMTDPPDVMVKLAQLIRGKINVLSQLLKRPVKTSIALTHMDQFPGYLQLSRFLEENQTRLTIPISSRQELEDLPSALESYEAHLPLALTTQQPADYLKIVSFITQAPDLMTRLASFVRSLRSPDPTTAPPEITSLSLTSEKDPEGSLTNPLSSQITPEEVSKFRPLRKHQLAAAAIVLLGLAYFGGGFLHERSAISKAHTLLDDLTTTPAALYKGKARRQFFEHIDGLNHSFLPALLPEFHVDHKALYKKQIHDKYIGALRNRILFPRLKRHAEAPDLKKVVFSLALLYGSSEDDLGKMIIKHRESWEDTLRLPGELIDDYLKYNRPRGEIELPIDVRKFGRTFKLTDDSDYASAVLFFQELTKSVKKPYITADQQELLRGRAASLLKDVESLDQYRMLAKVLDRLDAESGLSIAVRWRQRVRDLPKLESKSLRSLLEVLESKKIAVPDVKKWHLKRLMTKVKQIALKQSKSKTVLEFSVDTKTFRFKPAEWHALINRSRITLLLQAFAAEKESQPLEAFFSSRMAYVGPTGVGDPLFGGGGRVNGFYTKKAFDERVVPLLKKMPEFLNKLPVDKKVKGEFSEFVVQLVDDYAGAYIDAYRRYYRTFKYKRRTRGTLRFILAQFQLPTSPLTRFLSSIEKNTSLSLDEANAYLEPMAQVNNTFGFLQTLLAKPKGGAAALDGYGILLGQLETEIESTTPFTPADEGDSTNALRGKLSPLGRVALSIYLESEDSYLKQVEGWLNTSNVRPEWQAPFLGPVKIAFWLGLQDINRTVRETWKDLYSQYVRPLRATFPFRPEADTDAELSQLQEALHPQKGFWTGFNSYIAPVCTKKQGQWARRSSRLHQLSLPRKMLPLVNRMLRLSRKLWDDKGSPKPMTLSVKPMPLPSQRIGTFAVVLAYLQVGESTVFSFNQNPCWHEVELKWWKSSTAAVGAAFARVGQSKKVYRNKTAGDSMWSFYRLLRRSAAKRKNKKSWVWVISSPGADQAKVSILFKTRRDPWTPFRTLMEKTGSG